MRWLGCFNWVECGGMSSALWRSLQRISALNCLIKPTPTNNSGKQTILENKQTKHKRAKVKKKRKKKGKGSSSSFYFWSSHPLKCQKQTQEKMSKETPEWKQFPPFSIKFQLFVTPCPRGHQLPPFHWNSIQSTLIGLRLSTESTRFSFIIENIQNELCWKIHF